MTGMAPVVDFWGWVSSSLPAGGVVNGIGLASLATLFATDRVLTIGQHRRRVADLVDGHKRELAETVKHHLEVLALKDASYGELKESRDNYNTARKEERARADKVTAQLAESVEITGRLAEQLVGAYVDVKKEAGA